MPAIRSTPNPNANADAWRRFDRQASVKTSASGVSTVDHAGSVLPNLKAAGTQLANIFRPDHFEAAANDRPYLFGGLRKRLAAVEELVDVVRMPVAALKNGVDAATHGVLAAKDKLVDFFG